MDINSIKGLSDEQLINLLEMLFVNMNNLDKAYYDMFFNPIPMIINLERYNEQGVLEVIPVKNRAMDKLNVTTGRGTPEGVITASTGALYHDILTNNIYIKIYEESSTGWVLLHTSSNFLAGTDYLKPDGDGSQLQNISFSKFSGGIIKPIMGGTGKGGYNDIADFVGIMKANGEDPCSIAKPREDYLIPEQFIGSISYFAYDPSTAEVPTGWLPANGSKVPVDSYPVLYNRIKNTFGDEVTEDNILYFILPDLRDLFIRSTGVDRPINTKEESAAPNITGDPIPLATKWTDTKGNFVAAYKDRFHGAIYGISAARSYFDINDDSSSTNGPLAGIDASRSSKVYKNNMKEIRPANVALMPCIFAGISLGV